MVLAFTEGLVKEVVMGVADTATFVFKLVVDPVKTTTEMKNQAKYLIDHPEVLVEAAKMAYRQFDEGTPEEKAAMLGSVASILVPGLQIIKAGKAGKALGEVEDVVSQAAKDALQGIKQKLPNLGPVVQTAEGFVFKIGEIQGTPALPKTPVQQRYMDGLEGGVEGTGKGTFPTKLIDPEADKHIIDKVTEARSGLSNKYKNSGNFAYAEVNVAGVNKTDFFAHSGVHDASKGISGTGEFSFKPSDPIYKATEAPDNAGNIYLRDGDTEYKILNDVASKLGDNKDAAGTIRLFTEKDTCGSCNNIIQQFQKDFPNIKVEVLHNGDTPISP
ncbi:deaminase domain-containing protein [Paenibacillus sp. FSL H8-0332]|uniref:deaminase domain-containing protein n=1 Tax=Paenibacillus sp. FSL H8-0332 TaxID=2954742 RepID=UPI0030CE124F